MGLPPPASLPPAAAVADGVAAVVEQLLVAGLIVVVAVVDQLLVADVIVAVLQYFAGVTVVVLVGVG